MEFASATGRICYNPDRTGIKKKHRDTKSWCVIEVPNGIGYYYRWWLKKMTGITLSQPTWGTHITILDGRLPVQESKLQYWKKYDGHRIRFEYSPDFQIINFKNNRLIYFTLPVKCDSINEIRNELGFKPLNPSVIHLTYGVYIKNDQPKTGF